MNMGRSKVVDYVVEEVIRQGHDVTRLDGIERVGWMLNGWRHGLLSIPDRKPTINDIIWIAQQVEPYKNGNGIRTCDVMIAGRLGTPPEHIRPALEALWESIDLYEPIQFYKAFEKIHPFADGNGRTGKILLNWLNKSLLDPIFPPNNLWGREILNP